MFPSSAPSHPCSPHPAGAAANPFQTVPVWLQQRPGQPTPAGLAAAPRLAPYSRRQRVSCAFLWPTFISADAAPGSRFPTQLNRLSHRI